MPANRRHEKHEPFPTRSVAGGWRDRWDDDDAAEIRAKAEATERRYLARAERLGVVWQRQIAREATRKRRGRNG